MVLDRAENMTEEMSAAGFAIVDPKIESMETLSMVAYLMIN